MRDLSVDARILEGTLQPSDTLMGEKYEGKYKFTSLDQADEEISLLKGKVESLKVDIKEYDCDLENTFTRYREARRVCRSLSEDIEKLQETRSVQSGLMEAAKREGTKLEEKIAECKERMGKYETRLGHAQEARQKVLNEESSTKSPIDGSPDAPREQGRLRSTGRHPTSPASKMDNEMVQKVVSRMASISRCRGMLPPHMRPEVIRKHRAWVSELPRHGGSGGQRTDKGEEEPPPPPPWPCPMYVTPPPSPPPRAPRH